MFGIGMGPSNDQNQEFGKLKSASDFATNLGETNLTAGSKFMQSILSGDSSKISDALAPQIGAAKTAAANQNMTTAQNGTRGGGTAASTAATNDKIHSDITSLIGQLTDSSANGLMSSGGSLLSTGVSGTSASFGAASALQKQREAQINDIVSSTAAIAAAPFTGGASLTGLASPSGGGGGDGGAPSGQFSIPDWMKTGGGVPSAPMSMYGG